MQLNAISNHQPRIFGCRKAIMDAFRRNLEHKYWGRTVEKTIRSGYTQIFVSPRRHNHKWAAFWDSGDLTTDQVDHVRVVAGFAVANPGRVCTATRAI